MEAAKERAGGVLLHPTSLPGPHGIGDLGPWAHRWVEWVARSGCRLWQVLPLGPTGYGDSPYQSFSAFGGNPLLVSLEGLVEEGLLSITDLQPIPQFRDDCVQYGMVKAFKEPRIALAAERFSASSPSPLRPAYEDFCRQNDRWLNDYALFMTFKEAHGGLAWTDWDTPLASRETSVLRQAAEKWAGKIEAHRFAQFLFFRQWAALHKKAEELGITIVGDMPFLIAHDSVDVWAHPGRYQLDEAGKPTVVAGVPPDYFSSSGQRWGNPHYRWDRLQSAGYEWWIERIRNALALVHILRLDHFRGFESYWEIPAEAPSAREGRWVPGPGAKFFEALKDALGGFPFIAEDLGIITPEVGALRQAFDLPGMKVLQFAFDGDAENEFLPHNFEPNTVVYTGTHDNDTTVGWYAAASEEEKSFAREYLHTSGRDIAWDLIEAAWSSEASWSVAPMQDFLSLGTEARMNFPSRPEGNWTWRLTPDQLNLDLARRIRDLHNNHGRLKDSGERTL